MSKDIDITIFLQMSYTPSVFKNVENDMLSVSHDTVVTMCDAGGIFTTFCADDLFWKKRVEKLNPNLISMYESLPPLNRTSYYDFYKNLADTGVMNNIIFPIDINKNGLFFIYPIIREPYLIIKGRNDNKYTLIPDTLIMKINSSSYRVMKFPRNTSREAFFRMFNSGAGLIIASSSIPYQVAQLASEGYLQVNEDFSKIQQGLIEAGRATII